MGAAYIPGTGQGMCLAWLWVESIRLCTCVERQGRGAKVPLSVSRGSQHGEKRASAPGCPSRATPHLPSAVKLAPL